MESQQPEFNTKNEATLQAYGEHRKLVEDNLKAGERAVKLCAETDAKKRDLYAVNAKIQFLETYKNSRLEYEEAKAHLDAAFAKQFEALGLNEEAVKAMAANERQKKAELKAKITTMKEEMAKIQKWLDENGDEEALREKVQKDEEELLKLVAEKRLPAETKREVLATVMPQLLQEINQERKASVDGQDSVEDEFEQFFRFQVPTSSHNHTDDDDDEFSV